MNRNVIALVLGLLGSLVHVCKGSFTSFSRCPRYVRSSPESGRIADIGGRLKSADIVAKVAAEKM